MTTPSLPLVLIHGWNTNAACWNALLDIPTHRKLLPLELPGYGHRHNEASPGTLDQLTDDLLGSAPGQAIWCGWSLGSMVVMHAAIKAPQRVKGLMLISPTPRFLNGSDWDNGIDSEVLEQFSEAAEESPEAALKRFTLLMFESCDNARRRARHFIQQLQERGSANPQALQAGLHILAQSDLRKEIANLSQPTCLLAGSRDRICPAAAARWLSTTTQWPVTEVDDGHALLLEHANLILPMADQLETRINHV